MILTKDRREGTATAAQEVAVLLSIPSKISEDLTKGDRYAKMRECCREADLLIYIGKEKDRQQRKTKDLAKGYQTEYWFIDEDTKPADLALLIWKKSPKKVLIHGRLEAAQPGIKNKHKDLLLVGLSPMRETVG